jgi:hypothetical protein
MNKAIVIFLAISALSLGGCAAGNLPGGSALPMASQGQMRPSDSVGGGLPGPTVVVHQMDSVGGGLPGPHAKVVHHLDSVGGGLPGPHAKVVHHLDSVGGGLPGLAH